MTWYVYYLFDLDETELLYIGRSNKPRTRQLAFERKYEVPTFMGLCQRHATFDEASKAELQAIAKHRPPFNKHYVSSLGGLGQVRSGFKHTPEVIEIIRATSTGRRQSPETCLKKSEALKGEKAPWFGKKFSPETRAKMSAAQKARYAAARNRHQ